MERRYREKEIAKSKADVLNGNDKVWKDNGEELKGLAQAKIIKKSVILFRVLNMTIWYKHVHRLELQIFIIFVLRIHQLG